MAFGTKVVYFYVTDMTGLVAAATPKSATGAQLSVGGVQGAGSTARFPLLDALLSATPPTHHNQKQALMLRYALSLLCRFTLIVSLALCITCCTCQTD